MAAAKWRLLIGLVSIAWLAILPGTTATAQDRRDRRMDIINDTGRVVQEFYATNSKVKNWGRDLLGQDVIQPGQSYRFNFSDGTGQCTFDFRAVLDNGRFFERYRVDVCKATSWRLSGAGSAAGSEAGPNAPNDSQRPSRAMPGPETGPGPSPGPGPSGRPPSNATEQDI